MVKGVHSRGENEFQAIGRALRNCEGEEAMAVLDRFLILFFSAKSTKMKPEIVHQILNGLNIGECLAVGKFDVSGQQVSRPLKMSFRGI